MLLAVQSGAGRTFADRGARLIASSGKWLNPDASMECHSVDMLPERREQEGIRGILGQPRVIVRVHRRTSICERHPRYRHRLYASFRYLWRAGGDVEKFG